MPATSRRSVVQGYSGSGTLLDASRNRSLATSDINSQSCSEAMAPGWMSGDMTSETVTGETSDHTERNAVSSPVLRNSSAVDCFLSVHRCRHRAARPSGRRGAPVKINVPERSIYPGRRSINPSDSTVARRTSGSARWR